MATNSNHSGSDECLFAAQYVEDFMDFCNNTPDDIARHSTILHEIDQKYQVVLKDLDHLWEALHTKGSDPAVCRRILLQAQNAHILAQELGDSKLQQWQIILDIIENKSRQLELDKKRLDFGRETDVHTESHRPEVPTERTSKRSRRQRNIDITIRDEGIHDKLEKDLPIPTTCKKQKKKKRKSKADKEQVAQPFEPPIDPNEPTYCLCDQVSFGEMICCDNQNCPREWFHFSCVGLTFKPKGKWYCPKCRGERSNQMKPQVSWTPRTNICLCGQDTSGCWVACDHDNCLIEWFHFKCVGLDKEPEGKWHCPNCRLLYGDPETSPELSCSSQCI